MYPLNGERTDGLSSRAIRTGILSSLKTTKTPLNTRFFSQGNINAVQRNLQRTFKAETGISIDKQDNTDVLAFMRYIFINSSTNPYGNVESQIDSMNAKVVQKMLPQVREGVSAYLLYLRDAATLSQPNDLPESMTNKGKCKRENNVGF